MLPVFWLPGVRKFVFWDGYSILNRSLFGLDIKNDLFFLSFFPHFREEAVPGVIH